MCFHKCFSIFMVVVLIMNKVYSLVFQLSLWFLENFSVATSTLVVQSNWKTSNYINHLLPGFIWSSLVRTSNLQFLSISQEIPSSRHIKRREDFRDGNVMEYVDGKVKLALRLQVSLWNTVLMAFIIIHLFRMICKGEKNPQAANQWER